MREESLFVSLHDARGRYLASVEFEGSASGIGLPYRRLVESAFANRAVKLLLAHNHPSGDATPSAADVDSTRSLLALCAPLGLELCDHLVVGRTAVTSMREAGYLARSRRAA
jgi:DNA repair protein RadC